ncbi:sigma-54-dependent Fis family transcriptional regulator, partial [Pseudoduganella sp. DS3]
PGAPAAAAPIPEPAPVAAAVADTAPAMPPLPVFDVLPSNLPAYLEAVERDILTRALAQTNYNRTQAAQLLGISFRQLRYQMQKLNIQDPD